jgi:hypothetical protein
MQFKEEKLSLLILYLAVIDLHPTHLATYLIDVYI